MCQDSQSWLKFCPSYEPGKAVNLTGKEDFSDWYNSFPIPY